MPRWIGENDISNPSTRDELSGKLVRFESCRDKFLGHDQPYHRQLLEMNVTTDRRKIVRWLFESPKHAIQAAVRGVHLGMQRQDQTTSGVPVVLFALVPLLDGVL